jgi:hypothetical protein
MWREVASFIGCFLEVDSGGWVVMTFRMSFRPWQCSSVISGVAEGVLQVRGVGAMVYNWRVYLNQGGHLIRSASSNDVVCYLSKAEIFG